VILAFALMLTAAWIGFLGFEIFKLAEPTFLEFELTISQVLLDTRPHKLLSLLANNVVTKVWRSDHCSAVRGPAGYFLET
jgi:hypothetical protein